MYPIPEFHAGLVTPYEEVAVITLEGDVDIYSAPQFKQVLMGGIEEYPRHVIVDLTKATFLDSTGLGVLVNAAKRARKGALSIVCCDESMSRIFDIVGLRSVFVMYATRQEALKAAVVADGAPC